MPLKVAGSEVAFLQTHCIPTHSFKDTRVQGPAETYELVRCSEKPQVLGEAEMNTECMHVGEHRSHLVTLEEPESGRRLGAQIPAWRTYPVWDLI